MRDHPLSDVFSSQDLEHLAAGRCPRSGAQADPDIAWLLTEAVEQEDPFIDSIGQWYSQAAKHGETVQEYYKIRLRTSTDSRAGFFRWCGELMVGWFLERQCGFTTEYVEEGPDPTPDFHIQSAEVGIRVEVKTLVGGVQVGFVGALASRAPLIRDAIKGALRQLEKEGPNLLLVADFYRPPLDPHTLIDALFGDLRLCLLYSENGPVGDCFPVRDENIRFQPTINTRVGAVGTLLWNGMPDCHAQFYHNPHARCPVPPVVLDPWPQLVPDARRQRMIWRNRVGSA